MIKSPEEVWGLDGSASATSAPRSKLRSPEDVWGIDPAQIEEERSVAGVGLDIAKSGAAGLIKDGLGAAVRGAGELAREGGNLLAKGLNAVTGSDFFRAENPLDAPATMTEDAGQAIADSRTATAKRKEAESQPTGNLFTGKDLSFGKNPSVEGYVHQGISLLGQMAPVLAATVLGAGPAAVAGMLQGGGSAAKQAREEIAGMDEATLVNQSKAYRDLLASGMSPDAARKQVSDEAEKWAFRLTAPISAVGGAATGKILGKAGGHYLEKTAKTTLGKVGVGATLSGGEEALQELGENTATNAGINVGAGTDKELGEGSFASAVLGFFGGAGPGGAKGYASRTRPQEDTAAPKSRALLDAAMVDAKGAGAAIDQQQELRAKIAYSLANMDPADREGYIGKVAASEEEAARLNEWAADADLIELGKSLPISDDSGESFADINEMIRGDAGLIDDHSVEPPTAVQVANEATTAMQQAAVPEAPQGTNSASYVPEPLPQLQAQLQAVREGRKPIAFMGVQEAQQLDLNGLQYAEAVDPNTGESGIFVAQTPELVQQASTLTQDIGLREAAGKMLGYVNPTLTSQPSQGAAVVQQLDGQNGQVLQEEAVRPHEAGSVQRIPGTTLNFTNPAESLARRAEAAAQSTPEPVSSGPGAAASFHGGTRPTPPAQKLQGAVTDRSRKLVATLNASYGLKGDAAISEDSVHEVAPAGDLRRIARAMKWATGTDVVFIQTPKGSLMRGNGEAFQTVRGVADPKGNTVYMNVENASTLNTLGHEVTHVLEQQVPEAYAKLEDVVFTRMRAARAHELRRTLTAAMQAENGADAQAVATMHRKEVVAEAIGELAQSPALWNDVFRQVGQDRGMAQKFYDIVSAVLDRIKTAFTREGYITGVKDMQAVRSAFREAYAGWAKQHAALPKPKAEKPKALGYSPLAGTPTVFPDGSVSLNGEQELQHRYAPQGKATEKPAEKPAEPAEKKPEPKPLPKPKALTPEGFPITLDDNDPLLQPTIEKNSPDRILLRLGIVAKHFALRKPSHDPILITLGGGGGVGKTTVLNVLQAAGKMPGDDKLVKVNADDIKEMLPEYEQIKRAGDWRAAMTVHEESSLLVKAIQARALGKSAEDVEDALKPYVPAKAKGRYDILIDATMSEVGKGLKLLTEATERGFDVRMVAVVADPAAAIDRAKKRGAGSGRYVPTEVLAKAHAGFLKAVEQYSHVVREFHLWDNQTRPAKAVSLKEHHEALETYRGSAEKLAAKHQPGEGSSEQAGSGPDNRPGSVRPNPQAERGAGEGAGQEQSQNELAGGVEPEAPPQPAGPVPEGATSATDRPVVEFPIDKLSLSKEVPQFKEGADAEGVTADAKLHGKFDRRLAPPIAVWIRKDGRAEVISGRHRLDLARRSGEPTIPAQVYHEGPDFTSEHARLLDIELNVKDGRGKVKDYVAYFQERKSLTEQEARAEGLLNTAIGRAAYRIAHEGTAPLIAAHKNGAITDQGAVEVAQAAPNNERLQAVGLKYLQDGKPINFAVNMMRAVQAAPGASQDGTGDLFGLDDTGLKEAEAVAKEAVKQQAAIRKEITAVRGAAANPELARKNGVEVLDPEDTRKKIAELEHRLNALERFQTSDELIRELREAAGLQTKPKSIPELRAALEAAEPLTMEHVKALDALRDAMQADAQQTMDKGEMPVYRNSAGTMVVTITPSAQNPGKLQLTRYINDRGIVGDSQYNSLDDLMRQEGLTNWERVEGEAAEKALAPALQAQAEYEARRAEGEAFMKAPTPEEVVAKQEAEAAAKAAESDTEAVTVTTQRLVKRDATDGGTYTELTLSNGQKVDIQRLNSTESQGLAGWHDTSTPHPLHTGPGYGWLGDTKAEAIKEVERRATEAQKARVKKEREEAAKRELDAKVQASADHFQLGQNPDDAVSGQTSLLSRDWLKRAEAREPNLLPAALMHDLPEAVRAVGSLARNVPTIIRADIARKLLSGKEGERPGMTHDEVLNLPELLRTHAVASFEGTDRAGGVIVVTDKIIDNPSRGREPLVLFLHPSEGKVAGYYVADAGGLRAVFGKSNALASAHSRSVGAIRGWLKENASKSRPLWIDNELLKKWEGHPELGVYRTAFAMFAAEHPQLLKQPKNAAPASRLNPYSLRAAAPGVVVAQGPTTPILQKGSEIRKPGERTMTLKKKPDAPLQRNATKATTVAEALQMTATGKMPYDLGDALERHQWADALHLAKSPQERKTFMRELMDKVIEVSADALVPVKRWMENLPLDPVLKQRLTGNLYRASTLRATMEKEVADTFRKPLFDAIDKAARKHNLTTDQVKTLAGWWMTARYSPKANALLISKDRVALAAAQRTGDATKIAEAQKNLNDRLASVNGAIGAARTRGVAGGLNNAEAAQMVRNVEGKIDRALLDEIAKPVYGMMQWRKAKDLSTGRVSQAMVNSWPNHPDYVPLTGDPRATRDDADLFNAGNHLNQDGEKALNGRMDSVADNAIDAAVTATVKSINHASIQEFKQSLMKAYTAAKRQGTDIGLEIVPLTGIVRNSDDVVIYRDTFTTPLGFQENRAYAFKFADSNVIRALKRDAMEQVPSSLEKIGAFTRWYGKLVTQFTFAFAPINMVRDIWERSELLRTRSLLLPNGQRVDTNKAARAAIADTLNPEVWQATFYKSFKRGRMTQVRGELEEMIRLGGSSTWGDYLSRQAGELEREMRRHGSKTAQLAGKLTDKIEGYNNTFEFVPALAIYRSLKRQGMEAKDAAAATLDLMDFKKRGSAMPFVRALYVFAQPAATSGYNLAQYLNTRQGKVRFAAQFAVATLVYAGLRGLWGDDDDEELGNRLDNLSNFTVERSLPVPVGDKVLKLPVGFGPPQLAWQAGVTLDRFTSGRYTGLEALGEVAKGWAKSVAPVAPSDMEISKRPVDWLIQTFTPTVAKPLMSIGQDITGMGGQLTPMFKDPNKLKAMQANRTTPAEYQQAAQWIQETTGLDLYPDHIKAIVQGYGVGPIQQLLMLYVDNPARAQRGEPERLPLVTSIVDSVNDRAILNSVYYRVREDLADANRKYMTDPEKYEELADLAQAYKVFASREKMISAQRGQLKKAAPDMDPDEVADRMQAIESQSDEAHRAVLRQYLGSR